MTVFTDQLNRKITLAAKPKRIISLVPSQTELLYDLGLNDEVVGITKFCIYPDRWFRTKERVGGTKNYDLKKIARLNPDLIIGNKEENEQLQIEALMEDYNVWMSDIYTLKDALDMVTRLGALVDKAETAALLKLKIESAFKNFTPFKPEVPLKAAYLIWKNPYMVAGKNTFITEMLQSCGLVNVFATDEFNRYPVITVDQIKNANPDVFLLSSEPYPFREKHYAEFQSICENAKIMLVDGEIFSWYGSRLLQAPAYFLAIMKQLNSKIILSLIAQFLIAL